VIVGGLFSALFLVLTVLPSLYLILVGEREYVPKKQKDLEPYSYLDQYPLKEYESKEFDLSTETKKTISKKKQKSSGSKKKKKE
ncbi:AcrB/AcrD/AcrF family protein, partial [Leptospira interrogans serovar Pomona]|nr:AcrB/AcrD/AcrF family protein [Leptospira interrogans serovar Pomona]